MRRVARKGQTGLNFLSALLYAADFAGLLTRQFQFPTPSSLAWYWMICFREL
jgi:hypothetical protein